MTTQGQGAGNVLIYAAESGNPEMVRRSFSISHSWKCEIAQGKPQYSQRRNTAME